MWKIQNLIKKKLRAKPISESFKKIATHPHLQHVMLEKSAHFSDGMTEPFKNC